MRILGSTAGSQKGLQVYCDDGAKMRKAPLTALYIAILSVVLERRIQIATTTGFYREVNDLILQQARRCGMIKASICSCDVRQGRPAPFMIFHAVEATGVTSVAEVMNVRDTPLDLRSGTNAGVGWARSAY